MHPDRRLLGRIAAEFAAANHLAAFLSLGLVAWPPNPTEHP